MTTAAVPLLSSPPATSSTRLSLSLHRTTITIPTFSLPTQTPSNKPFFTSIRCQVAIGSDSPVSVSGSGSGSSDDLEDEEVKTKLAMVGSKVKVKSPLKIHHIPRVPDFELTPELQGVIKQYVGFRKGKRISANYPFKVEFHVEIDGRGKVKFFVHLREDEFEVIE